MAVVTRVRVSFSQKNLLRKKLLRKKLLRLLRTGPSILSYGIMRTGISHIPRQNATYKYGKCSQNYDYEVVD